jgi:hypothetical protein
MRSFLQRAQQEENPNVWLPWFQRLLNTPAASVHIVWEEGFRKVPGWILLRHVLVFCYSMNLHKLNEAGWSAFLETVVKNRSAPSLNVIVASWTAFMHPEVINMTA